MNRTTTAAAALMLGALLAGCQGKGSSETSAQHPAPATEAQAPATGGAADEAVPAGAEIQLAGTLGCGHCTFGVTGECAACVKTASGEVYVLDGVDEKSPLWDKRVEEGHQLTAVATMVGGDKPKHVTLTSYDLK